MELDPYSMLIIDPKGTLHRIYCPIKAIVIVSVSDLVAGDRVAIDKILEVEGLLVYYIRNVWYVHSLFVLIL